MSQLFPELCVRVVRENKRTKNAYGSKLNLELPVVGPFIQEGRRVYSKSQSGHSYNFYKRPCLTVCFVVVIEDVGGKF